MNAPAPARDPFGALLILAGLGCAAVAVIELDKLLVDIKTRLHKLEERYDVPREKTAGAEYVEELVGDIAKKAARPRPARTVKDQEA